MSKVKFGLKNVHYALATIAADGTATYGTPVRIPGAVSLSMEPSGENTPFYADDSVYFTAPGATGYTGDLTIALVPDSFKKDCLGEDDSVEGVLIEAADASPKPFALMFEFTTDEKAQKHVLYNCTAKRPSIASNTKGESTEVQTEALNLTASSIFNAALGKSIVKAKADDTAQAYDTWYTSVFQPASE